MTDLTKITTPFGLLDPETQKALREHGGPYEVFFYDGWNSIDPMWIPMSTYRVKPEPPKPREWWVNRYRSCGLGPIHSAYSSAIGAISDEDDLIETIHVREVLE